MIEYFKKLINEETFAERSQRMIPAALFGASMGIVYTLTLSAVNVLTFPALPIGLDWLKVFELTIGYALGLALFGAISAWFTEEYAGIAGGGVIITIILAVLFLFTTRPTTNTMTTQTIITALPLIGISMLAAWGLRWTAHRHLEIVHGTQGNQRRNLIARHLAIIFLVGFIPGVFNRMDLPAQQTLTYLHELLQSAPDDPSVLPRLPLKQVPELENHLGVDYLLYPSRSVLSAGALDVTIRFVDDFVMTCILPVNAGSNFITDCFEGTQN